MFVSSTVGSASIQVEVERQGWELSRRAQRSHDAARYTQAIMGSRRSRTLLRALFNTTSQTMRDNGTVVPFNLARSIGSIWPAKSPHGDNQLLAHFTKVGSILLSAIFRDDMTAMNWKRFSDIK